MKNLRFKTGISILMVLLCTGATVFGQKAEKEISRDYKISKDFTLGIDNKYGSIDVVNWDKDELSVVVKIETEAVTQSKAESLLEKVNINIAEKNAAVNFETDIDLKSLSTNNKVNITYKVMTPKYLNVLLEQSYGDIFIQEITGSAAIVIRYGDLDATTLRRETVGEPNTIDVAYGDVSIEVTGMLEAEVKYSDFEVAKSEELSIESAYSKLMLGDVSRLVIESKYDKIVAEKMNVSASVESAYSQVSLGSVSDNFELIEAEMSYGNLKGELSEKASFNINATTAYGSISVREGNYTSVIQANRHTISGASGTSPDSEINVSIRYGNLKLN